MRINHGLAFGVCALAFVATGHGTDLRASQQTSAPPRAGEAGFRSLYKELVEINTTLSAESAEGRQPDRGAAGDRREPETDHAARARRRRGSEARGLDEGSVQADRGGRLLLRA